ncbi:MAG: hypothetical protein HC897_07760, partial [Thermoanaerobaculia bacterium]|nr:hypothetical protein [Thermoanaerobaculia bacterium]
DGTSPDVVTGTDVLTLRGVFDTPLYWVNYRDAGTFSVDTSDPSEIKGRLLVDRTPQDFAPIANDLTALVEQASLNRPVPLVLVAARSDQIYAVVELDPASSNLASEPATVAFKAGAEVVARTGLPRHRRRAGRRRKLAERRRRQRFRPPGRARDRPRPRWPAQRNRRRNRRVVVQPRGRRPHRGTLDGGLEPDLQTHLFYLRISTLTTTDRAEQGFRSPVVNQVEDHAFAPAFNVEPATRYRRQLRTALVDLRNVE